MRWGGVKRREGRQLWKKCRKHMTLNREKSYLAYSSYMSDEKKTFYFLSIIQMRQTIFLNSDRIDTKFVKTVKRASNSFHNIISLQVRKILSFSEICIVYFRRVKSGIASPLEI